MIPIFQVSVFPALAVALSLGALLLLSGEAGARGGRRRISNYHEEYRAAAKPYSGVQGGAQFIFNSMSNSTFFQRMSQISCYVQRLAKMCADSSARA